jgi:hypothetical protein
MATGPIESAGWRKKPLKLQELRRNLVQLSRSTKRGAAINRSWEMRRKQEPYALWSQGGGEGSWHLAVV